MKIMELICLLQFILLIIDNRIFAQRSCFTVHGRKHDSLKKILEDKKLNEKIFLEKIIIDKCKREDMLKELRILGISRYSLFLDLESLTQELELIYKGFD